MNLKGPEYHGDLYMIDNTVINIIHEHKHVLCIKNTHKQHILSMQLSVSKISQNRRNILENSQWVLKQTKKMNKKEKECSGY